uniref:Uncharacterized protein n=1 Tax=Anguilla anguilla TaxID=7936 RepID=A0A0E9UJR0_ANGAN
MPTHSLPPVTVPREIRREHQRGVRWGTEAAISDSIRIPRLLSNAHRLHDSCQWLGEQAHGKR